MYNPLQVLEVRVAAGEDDDQEAAVPAAEDPTLPEVLHNESVCLWQRFTVTPADRTLWVERRSRLPRQL